jgi:hypothetical protein
VPRHRFDPVALVFGAVFVAAGLIVLAGGELIEEGRALVPAGLIALGVAVLVQVGRRSRPPAPAGTAAPPASWDVGDRDLDALFAPVDDTLADWDREHAATDPAKAGTDVDVTEVDATEADATPTDPEADATEVDASEPDATPTDPEADATEVDATEPDASEPDATEVVDPTEIVDPTERYPRSEPD